MTEPGDSQPRDYIDRCLLAGLGHVAFQCSDWGYTARGDIARCLAAAQLRFGLYLTAGFPDTDRGSRLGLVHVEPKIVDSIEIGRHLQLELIQVDSTPTADLPETGCWPLQFGLILVGPKVTAGLDGIVRCSFHARLGGDWIPSPVLRTVPGDTVRYPRQLMIRVDSKKTAGQADTDPDNTVRCLPGQTPAAPKTLAVQGDFPIHWLRYLHDQFAGLRLAMMTTLPGTRRSYPSPEQERHKREAKGPLPVNRGAFWLSA